MPGPLPKHQSQRRRRNKANPSAAVLLDAGGRSAPPLPEAVWSEEIISWWETIWSAPMASQYLDADVASLVRLARLKQSLLSDDVAFGVLAEIRQLEDRFGLSPLARRRLEWQIAEEDEVERKRQPLADNVYDLKAFDPESA